jgi:hypothetical protein
MSLQFMDSEGGNIDSEVIDYLGGDIRVLQVEMVDEM